jgi:hypothetical protein
MSFTIGCRRYSKGLRNADAARQHGHLRGSSPFKLQQVSWQLRHRKRLGRKLMVLPPEL